MNINTNTGRLTITKTEQKLLSNTKALLLKLAKHGDGDVADCAEQAAEEIGRVVEGLNKVEEEAAA